MFASKLPAQQLEALRQLVTKHIGDPALQRFVAETPTAATSTERGLQRWEQAHLVAALDVLLTYQRDRRAQSACHVAGARLGREREYASDPRTRIVELLKCWLRTHAGSASVTEEEVRGVSGLCRDILNLPKLFPARNPRSFLQSMAEVYEHLQLQLREVLEHDRSCATLAQRVLSLSRNLLSDAVGYLLLAPTDLRQTDLLPSLEVVALWQSLPEQGHPLPGRIDHALQRAMRDAWGTQVGSLIGAVLSTPTCVRLFDGARAEEEAIAVSTQQHGALMLALPGANEEAPLDLAAKFREVAEAFRQGQFRCSGLAGAFRDAAHPAVRERYLDTVQVIADLVFLLGEVLVQFHRISDGLGDYGMIRIAPWLHPFLDALQDKVQRLRGNLEFINDAVEGAYVLARARHGRVEKPAPSSRMCARAHACMERAVMGRGSHARALAQAVEDLRARSAPERLPAVVGSLGDACGALQAVLASPEFRASVGDAFPRLPALADVAARHAHLQPPPERRGMRELADAAGPWEDKAPAVLIDARATAAGTGTDSRSGARDRRASERTVVTEVEHRDLTEASAAGLQLCPVPQRSRGPQASRPGLADAPQSDALCDDRRPPHADVAAAGLVAEAYRLTASRVGRGLRRRERHTLALRGGRLTLTASGPTEDVTLSCCSAPSIATPAETAASGEVVLDVSRDIETCDLLPGAVLRLSVRASASGDGVFCLEDFTFEFDSVEIAAAFHTRIA